MHSGTEVCATPTCRMLPTTLSPSKGSWNGQLGQTARCTCSLKMHHWDQS